ncbi:sulfotransferase domain-containing protein [Gilvimarinus xylanilyticus]|uniref:Sulfotransferase domain-containing protein n=1 Tax=Gilvimarinus xylanilyticus TaxID=2944139 RepID=A0A9X2KUG8_9GAMM|nr:sulfotransferase domain-containing protein [Gilvimarinus xylanilyticus]MCP8900284.1 sulfotransferase domain-containing protein [Gilvimarinus xylanilyticus]
MDKKIVFIFGCQRSGTTALLKSLGGLGSVKAFPEARSTLCSKDVRQGLKLNPLDEVEDKVRSVSEDTVIIKPLVQSHYAADIMDFFAGSSSAIWMFRNYADVVASMLVKWPGIDKNSHLLPLFKNNKTSNMGFRDAYPAEVVEKAEILYESNPTKEEVCGMFWYARNSLYFKQRLSERKRVFLVGYDQFISQPPVSERLLKNVGIKIREGFVSENFNSNSFGKGEQVKNRIRQSIKEDLDSMYQRLVSESDMNHA